MKNHHRSGSRNLLFRLAAAAGLVAATALIAGCAYTQTMNERQAESERLQNELQYEQGRSDALRR
jgi:hypothetical protein